MPAGIGESPKFDIFAHKRGSYTAVEKSQSLPVVLHLPVSAQTPQTVKTDSLVHQVVIPQVKETKSSSWFGSTKSLLANTFWTTKMVVQQTVTIASEALAVYNEAMSNEDESVAETQLKEVEATISQSHTVLQNRGEELKALADWIKEAPDADVAANLLKLLENSSQGFDQDTPFTSLSDYIKTSVELDLKDAKTDEERLAILQEKTIPSFMQTLFRNGQSDLFVSNSMLAIGGSTVKDVLWGILPGALSQLLPFIVQSDKAEQLALAKGKPYEALVTSELGPISDRLVDKIFTALQMPVETQAKCGDLKAFLKPIVEYAILRCLNYLSELDATLVKKMLTAFDTARLATLGKNPQETKAIVSKLTGDLFVDLELEQLIKKLLNHPPRVFSWAIIKFVKGLATTTLIDSVILPLNELEPKGAKIESLVPFFNREKHNEHLAKVNKSLVKEGAQALKDTLINELKSKSDLLNLIDLDLLEPYVEYVCVRLMSGYSDLNQGVLDQIFNAFETMLEAIKGSQKPGLFQALKECENSEAARKVFKAYLALAVKELPGNFDEVLADFAFIKMFDAIKNNEANSNQMLNGYVANLFASFPSDTIDFLAMVPSLSKLDDLRNCPNSNAAKGVFKEYIRLFLNPLPENFDEVVLGDSFIKMFDNLKNSKDDKAAEKIIESYVKEKAPVFLSQNPLKMIDLANDQVAKKIIVNFIRDVFTLLPCDADGSVLGVPPFIGSIIEEMAVNQGVEFLFNHLYKPVQDLSKIKVVAYENDAIAGTTVKASDLGKTIKGSLRSAIDGQLDHNIKRDGHSEIIHTITEKALEILNRHEKPSPLITFLQDLVINKHIHPTLETAVGALNPTTSESSSALVFRPVDHLTEKGNAYRNMIVDLFYPIVANLAGGTIESILESEKQGGKAFDQALFSGVVLPDLLSHLEGLATSTADAPIDAKVLQAKGQQLLDQLAPGAKEMLRAQFPNYSEADFNNIWDSLVTENLAMITPMLTKLVFNEELAETIFDALYDVTIKSLNAPAGPAEPEEVLTAEDQAIDELVWKVLMASGRFAEYPSLIEMLPGKASMVTSLKPMLGKILRDQLKEGKFLENSFASGFANGGSDYVSETEEQIQLKKVNSQLKLNALERQLVVDGLSFGIKMIGEMIDDKLKVLDVPVVKQLKDMIVALCSFVLVRIVGGILRLVGIEDAIVNYLYQTLKRNREKTVKGFGDATKHEKLMSTLLDHAGHFVANKREA